MSHARIKLVLTSASLKYHASSLTTDFFGRLRSEFGSPRLVFPSSAEYLVDEWNNIRRLKTLRSWCTAVLLVTQVNYYCLRGQERRQTTPLCNCYKASPSSLSNLTTNRRLTYVPCRLEIRLHNGGAGCKIGGLLDETSHFTSSPYPFS